MPAASRSAQPRSRKRRLALRLGLAAASTSLALAGLELYLRAQPRPLRPPPSAVSLCRPLADASGLRYELIPGQVSKHALPGENAGEITYTINAAGYRGALAPPKPPGEFRIAVVGDSFVFGSLVDDAETFPHQLETLLAERCGPRPVRVINLGVPGYQVRQLVAQLELRTAALEPDLVLLDFYVNDPTHTADTYDGRVADEDAPPPTSAERWVRRLGLTRPGLRPDPDDPRQRWQFALRRRSALVDRLASALYAELEARDRRADQIHRWRPEGSGWRRILTALDRAVELAAQGGYRLHVSMYPTLAWIEGDYPLAEAHARLAAACRARGVPFHDLLPAFAGRDPRSLWVHPLDQHPNAAGQRLAAELLADQLALEILR